MNPRRKKAAWALALALPFLVTLSCTNSEVVGTGTGTLNVIISPQGDLGRYDVASLTISGVVLQALDPVVASHLSGQTIGVVTTPTTVDLTTGEGTFRTIQMPPGTYEVDRVRTLAFTLRDLVDFVPGVDCIDQVDTLASTDDSTSQTMFRDLRNFDPPFTFTVPEQGEGNLRITIDLPAFIELVESRFTCLDVGQCGNRPAPCLSGFRTPTAAQLKAVVGFQ